MNPLLLLSPENQETQQVGSFFGFPSHLLTWSRRLIFWLQSRSSQKSEILWGSTWLSSELSLPQRIKLKEMEVIFVQ